MSNRFHLLTLAEEDVATPAIPTQPVVVASEKSTGHPAAAAADKKRNGPEKNDRKSRNGGGSRRSDGGKHESHGKGSWGNALESAIEAAAPAEAVEAGASDETVAAEAAAAAPQPPAYKTVKEWLQEQERSQAALLGKRQTTAAVRPANEGMAIEADSEVVARSTDQVLLTIGGPSAAKKTRKPAQAASGENKKLSLQDLNKIVPIAVTASGSRPTGRGPAGRGSRGEEGKGSRGEEGRRRPAAADGHPRDGQQRTGEQRNGGERRHYRSGGNGESGGEGRRGVYQQRQHQQPQRVSVKDDVAFPALA